MDYYREIVGCLAGAKRKIGITCPTTQRDFYGWIEAATCTYDPEPDFKRNARDTYAAVVR